MNFKLSFDRLPQNVNTLILKQTSFINSYKVDELIALEKGEENAVEIMGQEIVIEDIYQKNEKHKYQ